MGGWEGEENYRKIAKEICSCRTDDVYLVANYITDDNGKIPPRNFQTDETVLDLLRACFLASDRVWIDRKRNAGVTNE